MRDQQRPLEGETAVPAATAGTVGVPGAHALGHRLIAAEPSAGAHHHAAEDATDDVRLRPVALVGRVGHVGADLGQLGLGSGVLGDGVDEDGDLADDVTDGLEAGGAGGEDAADLDADGLVGVGGGAVGGHEGSLSGRSKRRSNHLFHETLLNLAQCGCTGS